MAAVDVGRGGVRARPKRFETGFKSRLRRVVRQNGPFPEVRGGSSGIPRVAPAFRNLWKCDAALSRYCSGVI
jgi:hypothetical protein